MNGRLHFEETGQHEIRPLSNVNYVPLLLQLVPTGIVLVDDALRVREANELAATMLRTGNGLRIAENGRLTTEDKKERAKFETFLRQALSSGADSATLKAVRFVARRSNGLPILIVGANYVRKGTSDSAAPVRAVLCLREFAKRQKKVISVEDLRARYGLTAAEATLAIAILSGKTLAEHSIECRVSVNTTKTHLKAVLAKADVRRQADLIRELSGNG